MRRGMSLVYVLVATFSCGTLGTTDVVRARHARQFDCMQDSVRVIEQEDGSLRAWGCGPDTTYVCRGERLCSPQSRAVVRMTGGGSEPVRLGSGGTTAAGASTASGSGSSWRNSPPAPIAARDAGAAQAHAAQGASRDAGPPPPSDAVRGLLELRRSDILVCTGRSTVGVRATYAADGTLDLALQGELHGSPEEDCVRNALRDVRIAAPQHSGVVVHLIR